ncbi:RagB/SusD family nutrient uptake outer membrane protein [Chitinophaga polysaccharea]|uniref:RagB/SusD family nutrient uptake outer membrane protein n=1 Tax=Chitinophaga polysaccharea TaxID=1293035 RepID=UPI0014559938|nr:RagB/SusD family nutrient uptake outer membrane protein [Chitinophaga polysaccharea]NLR60328.1 RagB/SusD family nutrient uptake outer membrane protein [Chitinophaga polysaccharea]
MKSIIIKYGLLVVATGALCLAGCRKFLDETDPSNYTEDTYFTKPEHARSSINAIYASLRDPMSGDFNGAAWTMTEFATGQAATDLGQAVNSYYIKDLHNTADNAYGENYWRNYYKGITNANLSIAKIPGINMDQAEAKRLLGEAYFLRAWYYFNLVQMFGNIPLITQPVDLKSDQLRPKQATPEEVYKLIVDDLTAAENAGLPWMDVSGKASLGAVKSLLSKVYLTMAGYPLQKGTSYFDLAARKAGEVLASKQFKLFDTYNDLHNPAKKNVEENIFMIQYKTQVIPGSWQSLIIPYNKNISAYSAETGGIYATADFVKSYDPADLRAKEGQFFFTEFTNQDNRNQKVDLGGYFLYKLFDVTAQTTTANSDLNWSLIRYADILLVYAEATNEVSGPGAAAYDAVNQVRRRAKLPDLAGLTQVQLREAIWRERWYELCFENVTWFDMVRLRKAFNVSTKGFDSYVGHKFSYGPVLTERELLFPIPSRELRNNPNLVPTKGY